MDSIRLSTGIFGSYQVLVNGNSSSIEEKQRNNDIGNPYVQWRLLFPSDGILSLHEKRREYINPIRKKREDFDRCIRVEEEYKKS